MWIVVRAPSGFQFGNALLASRYQDQRARWDGFGNPESSAQRGRVRVCVCESLSERGGGKVPGEVVDGEAALTFKDSGEEVKLGWTQSLSIDEWMNGARIENRWNKSVR